MKPPYEITSEILKLVTTASEKIGEAKANFLNKPSPTLRKQNKIKTIHSSLRIEGNTLTEEQITAILDNKRVVGPQKDILEVVNAINVYDQLSTFKAGSLNSFLSAHKILMKGLIENEGKLRTGDVGIVQGSKVAHLAPPSWNVQNLMKDLFRYVQDADEITLIKGCVFHYEMEFIHPFFDGNGRMGRLWQTVILMTEHSIFEFLPLETMISKTQQDYYDVLSKCDKAGSSTMFIEYMLGVIITSLNDLLKYGSKKLTEQDRLEYFLTLNKKEFSRKDYLDVFKDISSATASRDLKRGVDKGYFIKTGEQNRTIYKIED